MIEPEESNTLSDFLHPSRHLGLSSNKFQHFAKILSTQKDVKLIENEIENSAAPLDFPLQIVIAYSKNGRTDKFYKDLNSILANLVHLSDKQARNILYLFKKLRLEVHRIYDQLFQLCPSKTFKKYLCLNMIYETTEKQTLLQLFENSFRLLDESETQDVLAVMEILELYCHFKSKLNFEDVDFIKENSVLSSIVHIKALKEADCSIPPGDSPLRSIAILESLKLKLIQGKNLDLDAARFKGHILVETKYLLVTVYQMILYRKNTREISANLFCVSKFLRKYKLYMISNDFIGAVCFCLAKIPDFREVGLIKEALDFLNNADFSFDSEPQKVILTLKLAEMLDEKGLFVEAHSYLKRYENIGNEKVDFFLNKLSLKINPLNSNNISQKILLLVDKALMNKDEQIDLIKSALAQMEEFKQGTLLIFESLSTIIRMNNQNDLKLNEELFQTLSKINWISIPMRNIWKLKLDIIQSYAVEQGLKKFIELIQTEPDILNVFENSSCIILSKIISCLPLNETNIEMVKKCYDCLLKRSDSLYNFRFLASVLQYSIKYANANPGAISSKSEQSKKSSPKKSTSVVDVTEIIQDCSTKCMNSNYSEMSMKNYIADNYYKFKFSKPIECSDFINVFYYLNSNALTNKSTLDFVNFGQLFGSAHSNSDKKYILKIIYKIIKSGCKVDLKEIEGHLLSLIQKDTFEKQEKEVLFDIMWKLFLSNKNEAVLNYCFDQSFEINLSPDQHIKLILAVKESLVIEKKAKILEHFRNSAYLRGAKDLNLVVTLIFLLENSNFHDTVYNECKETKEFLSTYFKRKAFSWFWKSSSHKCKVQILNDAPGFLSQVEFLNLCASCTDELRMNCLKILPSLSIELEIDHFVLLLDSLNYSEVKLDEKTIAYLKSQASKFSSRLFYYEAKSRILIHECMSDLENSTKRLKFTDYVEQELQELLSNMIQMFSPPSKDKKPKKKDGVITLERGKEFIYSLILSLNVLYCSNSINANNFDIILKLIWINTNPNITLDKLFELRSINFSGTRNPIEEAIISIDETMEYHLVEIYLLCCSETKNKDEKFISQIFEERKPRFSSIFITSCEAYFSFLKKSQRSTEIINEFSIRDIIFYIKSIKFKGGAKLLKKFVQNNFEVVFWYPYIYCLFHEQLYHSGDGLLTLVKVCFRYGDLKDIERFSYFASEILKNYLEKPLEYSVSMLELLDYYVRNILDVFDDRSKSHTTAKRLKISEDHLFIKYSKEICSKVLQIYKEEKSKQLKGYDVVEKYLETLEGPSKLEILVGRIKNLIIYEN